MDETITKICRHCGVSYNKPLVISRKNWDKRLCCSKVCGDKSKQTPWLKKHQIKKGQHLSPETQFKKGENMGTNNAKWVGNDVSYAALHHWIANNYGRPRFCEHCKTSVNRKYEWANVSDSYLRDRSDWLRLCVPCHSRFDRDKRLIAND